MGLDMYLEKKIFTKNSTTKIKGSIEIKTFEQHTVVPLEDLSYIILEVGYWRKANHIHSWFINNIQDGNDDCRPYYVDPDKLSQLRDICEKILKSKSVKLAEDLLPPMGGFFFGSTEIDDDYMDDLERTIEIIDKALKEPIGDLYYQSSW